MVAAYEIRVSGCLGLEFRHALADLCPEVHQDHTRLRAENVDQPSLHGILRRLRDLGLEIDEVRRTDAPTGS